MSAFKKSKPRLGVSLEKGTPDVPDDGKYYVIVDGVVVCSTPVLALAEIEYAENVEARNKGARDLLAKEQAYYTMQALRSDSFARRASNARKKGGRGGRGGV